MQKAAWRFRANRSWRPEFCGNPCVATSSSVSAIVVAGLKAVFGIGRKNRIHRGPIEP